MEHKHVTTTDGNSGSPPPPVAVMGVKDSPHSKTLSSSVSSINSLPDSTLDDPFGKDDYKPDKCTADTNSLSKLDNGNESRLGNSEKPISGSSIQSEATQNHSRSSSNSSSTTESPPTQVMERPTDKSYRIPSSVFDIDKSTNTADWSVASNESLFSIHMGTMSFTKDANFWHSGELGAPPDFAPSPQMCDFSPYQPSHELGIAEVEVSKESEDLNREKFLMEGRISHISTESGTSTKSFAFPILAGAVDKQYSVRMDTSIKSIPEQKKPQVEPPTEPPTEPDTEKEPLSEPKTPSATKNAGKNKGFSCFSCCSFCS